ncbi:hypothetical protein [Streptomyces sp. NPDC048551]|uniref:hypothetical protein n=1 Tax=Streptomyces sp. NPDC048551 TaxID=3155758 RepID=UPI003424980D
MIQQLDIIGEEFTVLHTSLRTSRAFASNPSVPSLTAQHRTAQDLAVTAMGLLQDLAEEPYARSNDGQEALAALGRLAQGAAEATVSIVRATTLAAQAHEDGLGSLPSWKAALLRQRLNDAITALKHTPGICRSAAGFTMSATAHFEAAAPAGKTSADAAGQSLPADPAVALLPAQQHALRTIQAATVTLSQVPREHAAAQMAGPESAVTRSVAVTIPRQPGNPASGTDMLPENITPQAIDQLLELGLVRRDTRTSLFVGQHLHTTPAGRRTLDRLGSPPVPPPPSPPVHSRPRTR